MKQYGFGDIWLECTCFELILLESIAKMTPVTYRY